ncbi:collagen-like protein [Alteromonas pelagimontana]|uniref:Collagen-like protein n=1 Tax=Alteromonas pelagimontana TaxID=1858656 RepID=A0A6M4MA61_9ALTE|nr:choice-of-anchor I family protein [Alteromonas pelagimontana]QJR80052.1 collagen-like protein [Alteromonas pelagimontana]
MTYHHIFKKSVLAVMVLATLSGCSLSGDDGEPGPQGEQGIPGEDGQSASNALLFDIVGRAKIGGVGAAEIVQYHSATHTVYATNSADGTISVISLAELTTEALESPTSDANLAATAITLPEEVDGVALGGLTSIAVKGDLMAVAIPAAAKSDDGFVLFYNGLDSASPTFLSSVQVGNLPDMVTFTPDGNNVLSANEGEPSSDYTLDPEGSISVIAIAEGVPAETASQVTFTDFNDAKTELLAQGMHFPNPSGRTIKGTAIATTVAQDLEPEYISATDTKAYVTLQENNGIAVIDLETLSVSIMGLGVKDWGEYSIDAQEEGSVSFGKYPGLYGIYMPDTIAHTQWKGAAFLLTANEGDAREYWFESADEASCISDGGLEFDDGECLAYIDETKVEDLTAAANSPLNDLQAIGEADDLRVSIAMGDENSDGEYDAAYSYGARSFSVWDQNGQLIFDSGDDFERITASIHGTAFNNGDEENEGDSRSENKGPEPEALTVGTFGENTYAFIGTERMGGIFVYDVTNPYSVSFVDYIINRDLTEGLSEEGGIGDLAPESLLFVPAEESPNGNALLVVGNEISGSVSVWQVQRQ